MNSSDPLFPVDDNYLIMTKYLLDHVFSSNRNQAKNQTLEELNQRLNLCHYTHQYLENLGTFYSESLGNIQGGVYDIEKRLRKKVAKRG